MIPLADAQARYPGAESFVFGDGPDLSAHLIALVRQGAKRATCGALRDYQSGAEAMPVVGRMDIVRGWDGGADLVIRTTSVQIIRFCDVTADFALSEGEDATLAGWQAGHAAFFARNGGFDPEMELVCERFELVEDFA
jgi:uncharacterized protein YhfF